MTFQHSPQRKPQQGSRVQREQTELPTPFAPLNAETILQFQRLMGNRATTQRFGRTSGTSTPATIQRDYDKQPVETELPDHPTKTDEEAQLVAFFKRQYGDFIEMFGNLLMRDLILWNEMRDYMSEFKAWMSMQIHRPETPQAYREFFLQQRDRLDEHQAHIDATRKDVTWQKDFRTLYGITQQYVIGDGSQIEVKMNEAKLADDLDILYTQGTMACAALIILADYDEDAGMYKWRLLAHLPAAGLRGMEAQAMDNINFMLSIATHAYIAFGDEQYEGGRNSVVEELEKGLGVTGIQQLSSKASFVRVGPNGLMQRNERYKGM